MIVLSTLLFILLLLNGSSSIVNAINATNNGNIAVSENTSCGFITSNKEPEKYADNNPPTAALPQHKLCNPPAKDGSVFADSLVFCTTIPSATTSLTAIHALLNTNAAIVYDTIVDDEPSPTLFTLSNSPQKLCPTAE